MNLFDVYPLHPIEISAAKGLKVKDNKGIEYLDLYGGHAVISIGHQHPVFVQAIERQLKKVAFYSNSVINPLQKHFAQALGKISGKSDYSLFLCSSGAEANENALKMASFYNKRSKIIAFSGAFHGRTSLAVGCTDNPKIRANVNRHDVIFVPFNDEHELEKVFKEQGNEIAAVIIEPIQGVGGIRVASNAFLHLIRRLCTSYNTVFIADEVQCGYGRTGSFFALDDSGIQADIYSMAKGMGNGFPIGGLILSERFKPQHGLLGTTFGGNHLACAAALAVLEVIDNENLIENAATMGAYIIDELNKFDNISGVRGRGLMIGIDLPEDMATVQKDLLFKEHIFTGVAKPRTVRLLPALSITKADADRFLESLAKYIR